MPCRSTDTTEMPQDLTTGPISFPSGVPGPGRSVRDGDVGCGPGLLLRDFCSSLVWWKPVRRQRACPAYGAGVGDELLHRGPMQRPDVSRYQTSTDGNQVSFANQTKLQYSHQCRQYAPCLSRPVKAYMRSRMSTWLTIQYTAFDYIIFPSRDDRRQRDNLCGIS